MLFGANCDVVNDRLLKSSEKIDRCLNIERIRGYRSWARKFLELALKLIKWRIRLEGSKKLPICKCSRCREKHV